MTNASDNPTTPLSESNIEDAPAPGSPSPAEADAATSGAASPSAEALLEQAQAELETLKDRHLRLQADFENFRRRTHRERAEAQARAQEELMRNLLPVLDHFEIGLRSAAEHGADASILSGFELVQNELMRVLERAGLVAVDAKPGDPFDPHLHEAVTHAPSDQHPADTVLQQTRRGYRLGPMLIRPAQVVVSSGPGPAPETTAEASDAGQ